MRGGSQQQSAFVSFEPQQTAQTGRLPYRNRSLSLRGGLVAVFYSDAREAFIKAIADARGRSMHQLQRFLSPPPEEREENRHTGSML